LAELPEHEVKFVRQYVESQTRDTDDPVKLVQKVGSRRVLGRSYDLYDVWMEKGGRWWVITNMTNLYSQDDFNSIEQAFTFHLGMNAILSDRFGGQVADEDGTVSGAWRRFTKAAEAMNDATEAEDFQAVGIRCREALLALVREHSADKWVPPQSDPPQLANFKAWMDIFAEVLTTSRARRYLKALTEKTWDLTVWLQHYTDATEWDAELVLDAIAHLLNTFSLMVLRHERGATRRCPQCDSYRLDEDGETAERDGRPGWWSQDVCSACGWRGEEVFEPFSVDHLRRMAEYLEGSTGECSHPGE
jgi:hypothetical protein